MPKSQSKKNRKLSRDRSLIIKVLLLLVCLSSLWYLYLKAGQRLLRPVAINQLEEIFGAKVELEDLRFELSGRVSMKGLRIHCADGYAECHDLLKAGELKAKFSSLSLFLLNPKLSRLKIEDFEVNSEYDRDSGQWNFAGFKKKGEVSKNDLPRIKIVNGHLRYSARESGELTNIIDIPVESGSFAGQGKSYEFHFKTKSKGDFAKSEIHGQLETDKTSKLLLEGQINNVPFDKDLSLWQINDIMLQLSFDEKDAQIENLFFRAGDKTQFQATGSIRDFLHAGLYDMNILINDVCIANEPRDNCLSYSAGAQERLGKFINRILLQYSPRGTGDININANGRLDEITQSDWNCCINLKDVTMLYSNFPYELNNVNGEINFSQKSLEIKKLIGRHHDQIVEIEGFSKYEKVFPDDWNCRIRVSSERLGLDEDLYKALSDRNKLTWISFSPSGEVSVDYVFTHQPERGKQVDIDIKLLNCSAVYDLFPYPVQSINGNILIKGGEIQLRKIKGFSGHDGHGRVEVDGTIKEIFSDNSIYDIDVRAEDVAIDENLKSAFSGYGKKIIDQFELKGNADFQVKIDNDPVSKEIHHSFRTQIYCDRLRYKRFGPRLGSVKSDLKFDSGNVRIYSFEGQDGETEFHLQGNILHPMDSLEKYSYVLDIDIVNAMLSDDVFGYCPAALCDRFKAFDFKGRFDMEGRIESTKQGDINYQMMIGCKNNSVCFSEFPYPLSDVNGKIFLTNDKAVLKNIAAVAGAENGKSRKPNVHFDGEFNIKESKVGQGEFKLRADAILIDNKLRQSFPPSMRDEIEKLSPEGVLGVRVDKGIVDMRDNQRTIDIQGRIDLSKGSFLAEEILRDVWASVDGKVSYVVGKGVDTARGNLDLKRFDYDGKQFENIRTELAFDYEKGLATTRDFIANLFGGKVTCGGRILKNKQGSLVYVMGAKFDRMQFDRILADREDETVLGSNNKIYGIVSGDYYIEGIISMPSVKQGRLNLQISDVEFGSRSLAANLVDKIQGSRKEYSFKFMKLDSVVKGNKLELVEIFLIGESISFKGSGVIDLLSKDVELDFIAHGSDITGDPDFAQSLANAFGGAIAEIKVRGNLKSPSIEIKTLGIFKQ